MATNNKDFIVKNGLVVGNSTNLVNYTSDSPQNPFVGQLWIDVDEDFPAEDPNLYLTSACAAALYMPISASNDYLFSYTASSIYLRQDSASAIYAPIYSASFLGIPTAPTASAGNNTTQIATTAFVRTEVSNLVASAPATLDTLNELATALGNDANFATTVTNSISGRVSKSGGDTITVSSGTTVPLTIQNNGTGNSFVVNDEASDTTPFIIDASGNVGIGNAPGDFSSRLLVLTPNGTASRFTLGQAGITNYSWQIPASTDAITLVYGASTERMRIDSSGRIQIPAGGIIEAPVSTNAQTGTAYTLVLTDAGRVIEMNNANANTLTVPLNSSVPFPIGTKIDIIQTGAGATSISPTAGVTLNSDTNKRTINSQWAAATLIKRATDTWVLVGALKT